MRPTTLAAAVGPAVALLVLMGAKVTYFEEALPSTMNPLFARTMVDRRAQELVFDRLYYRSSITAELRSRLVEREELSEDGRQLKVYLRDGVKWHDGEPLRPHDLCFTIDAMLDPDTPSQVARTYRDVIAECKVVRRERAAIVTFTKAFYNPRERLSFPILPEHHFSSTAVQPDDDFSARPVGTGPMRGVQGRREVRFTAQANAHRNAQIGILSMGEGGDPLVQVRSILNGGVHGLITVPPVLRAEVAASDHIAVKSYDLRSWWFAAANTVSGPLRDKAIRKAVDAALDRFELRRLTMGYDPEDIVQPCQFISGPFVPASSYYNRSVRVKERSDRAITRQLMTSIGAAEQHGIWVKDGEPVNLRIGMNAPLDLEAKDLLNQVGNQLHAAGFQREVFRVSADDWSRKAIAGEYTDTFDLLIGKWSFGVVENVDALFHTRTATGRGSLNLFGYSDRRVDALLDRYDAARTDTEAQNAYHELHARLAEELPYLFLWKLDTKSAWRLEVRDNTVTPYFYFTDFDRWTFKAPR